MIQMLHHSDWQAAFQYNQQVQAIRSLECGEVLYFPTLDFELTPNESPLLIGRELLTTSKNISFNPITQQIRGITHNKNDQNLLTLMSRYSVYTQKLLSNLLPHYHGNLMFGRTSFRPVEVMGRKTSPRQDDTRLHIDAFPSSPNQGKRILRVFTNINPEERNRIWNLGQSFETVVNYFGPKLKSSIPGYRQLISSLGITKSYRTLYDHYMLKLHDAMKLDMDYQREVDKLEFHFPPGSTWIVMTDAVSHAALSGQFMLEQTFYLEPENMQDVNLSPLKVLERYFGKSLIY